MVRVRWMLSWWLLMTSGWDFSVLTPVDINFVRPNVGVMSDSNQFSSPEMITPNLDKLAARSLVLTKAYTQANTHWRWMFYNNVLTRSFNRLPSVVPADPHFWLVGDLTLQDAMTMTGKWESTFQTSPPCHSTSRKMDIRFIVGFCEQKLKKQIL